MTYLETWTVDGYTLTQGTLRQWEYRSGTGKTGGLVGTNTTVPYRDGEIWTRKTLGPGSFVFNMWLAGTDAGVARTAYDELLRVVVRPERLCTWTRTPSDGSTARFCKGEVVAAVEPTYLGQIGYRMGIEVHVPAGKWQSVNTQTIDPGAGADTPHIATLIGKFAESTAPMGDLAYQVTGPINAGWSINDRNGPDSLVCNEALGSGQSVIIDAGAWSITGSGGYTPNLAAYIPNGPRLMTVSTAPFGGTPAVGLNGSGTSSNTNLTVTGRASYLV